ncbi:hypothetical protein C473_00537 [Halorubrum distributum JCM 10247]|uniref:Uncharacterized protein n=1 Tax=Halorubrum distributum JCM 10247 TaxID=1227486 RepID=M0DRS0_9EURY|nr:hypothetical protein C473_00537 [Halorubrum terrestre JCM 10247]
MPIRRAKRAESLYAEVVKYDLIVTPDTALASAINRRLDRPHFGTFATTPRRLAAGRRERAEDRHAFLKLVEETDHDWKAVAYAVGNVLQCWEHRGRLDAVSTRNADRVAVVLDGGGQYSSHVQSTLEGADIPFYGGPGFIDDPHHRAFVRLLRVDFRGSDTTVGDIRPLLT